jgi:hypothetical protein
LQDMSHKPQNQQYRRWTKAPTMVECRRRPLVWFAWGTKIGITVIFLVVRGEAH